MRCYISTREFAGGSTFAGVGAYAIKRAELIAGNPAAQVISFLVPAWRGGLQRRRRPAAGRHRRLHAAAGRQP